MRSFTLQTQSKREHSFPQIKITLGFCLSVTLMSLFDTSGMFGFALLAVMIHETGHIITIHLLNEEIKQISFRLFGIEIVAELSHKRKTAVIMIAGPLFNILSALILIPFALKGYIFAITMFYASITLGLFHLLPAYGLDGGNAVIYLSNGSEKVKNIVKGFAFTVSAMLFATGFYAVYRGFFNISAFILALYFMINCLTQRNIFLNVPRIDEK